MCDLTRVFISTQVKFTLGNLIYSLGNYTLVNSIPFNPTESNLPRVFLSTKVIFTLGNIFISLGNYTLIKFTLGNPTKGSLPQVSISTQVKITLANLILTLNFYRFTPGNSTNDHLTLDNCMNFITLGNLTLGKCE